MRFDVRDAVWWWRRWAKDNADKVLALNAKIVVWVSIVSIASVLYWWLPADLAYRRCVRKAEGDEALAQCHVGGVELYATLGYYLVTVAGAMLLCLAAYLSKHLVVGRWGTTKYWRRIPWWLAGNCAICLCSTVIHVAAWITFLMK